MRRHATWILILLGVLSAWTWTRPAPGPDNLRRPLWLPRSYKPAAEAYVIK